MSLTNDNAAIALAESVLTAAMHKELTPQVGQIIAESNQLWIKKDGAGYSLYFQENDVFRKSEFFEKIVEAAKQSDNSFAHLTTHLGDRSINGYSFNAATLADLVNGVNATLSPENQLEQETLEALNATEKATPAQRVFLKLQDSIREEAFDHNGNFFAAQKVMFTPTYENGCYEFAIEYPCDAQSIYTNIYEAATKGKLSGAGTFRASYGAAPAEPYTGDETTQKYDPTRTRISFKANSLADFANGMNACLSPKNQADVSTLLGKGLAG